MSRNRGGDSSDGRALPSLRIMHRDGRRLARDSWRAPSGGTSPDPRFSFANERTFLAWNRTALALVATGLAIDQLTRLGTRTVVVWLGAALMVLGGAVGVTGFCRWRRAEAALRHHRPLPRSRLAPSVLGFGLSGAAAASVALLAVMAVR